MKRCLGEPTHKQPTKKKESKTMSKFKRYEKKDFYAYDRKGNPLSDEELDAQLEDLERGLRFARPTAPKGSTTSVLEYVDTRGKVYKACIQGQEVVGYVNETRNKEGKHVGYNVKYQHLPENAYTRAVIDICVRKLKECCEEEANRDKNDRCINKNIAKAILAAIEDDDWSDTMKSPIGPGFDYDEETGKFSINEEKPLQTKCKIVTKFQDPGTVYTRINAPGNKTINIKKCFSTNDDGDYTSQAARIIPWFYPQGYFGAHGQQDYQVSMTMKIDEMNWTKAKGNREARMANMDDYKSDDDEEESVSSLNDDELPPAVGNDGFNKDSDSDDSEDELDGVGVNDSDEDSGDDSDSSEAPPPPKKKKEKSVKKEKKKEKKAKKEKAKKKKKSK